MAGLADAILIVEAGPQSGTLITMRLASEYNRELLCILLRMGAACVTESGHILEALHITPNQNSDRPKLPPLASIEQKIYDLLQKPLARDELIRESTMATHEALTTLITLELKGLIREEFGLWRRTEL